MERTFSLRILITVISLLLTVIWLSPAYAAAPAFESLGQITASAMRVPGAMDLDAAGNLYVADARGGLVHKFDAYGKLLQSWQLQATGRGLAVTPDGSRLYVSRTDAVVIADGGTGEVVASLAGGQVDSPEFGLAGGIDLDAAGNVFVADTETMQIKVYTASGQYQTGFGSAGSNAGQFMRIGGMAINPAGQVVVADASAANAKVHVFSLGVNLQVLNVAAYTNTTATNFGSPVMHAPRGIAFDAQGRGYFLEFISSQVRVTSAGFGYLGAYAKAGYAAGQLNNVIDAIYDNANNRLFVGCDTGRIEILGVDGGQSPVNVNHAPTVPTQQSPVAGSEVASLSPVLTIINATDADGDALTYKVVISQSNEVVYQAEVAAMAGVTTHVVAEELVENAAYTWTVQATDGKASSAVSAAANFVVNAVEEAPTVPELSAPVNGESIDGAGVLSWTASTDPDPNDLNITYLVEVAVDEMFTQIVVAETITATELTLGSSAAYDDLIDGTLYSWRVVAQDDSQVTSAPSTAGQFVYDTTSLTITANMPDAMVSFYGNHAYAGKTVGMAPLELRDFTPGALSVVVERAGFEPFVAQVTLAEAENVELYAALVPAMNVKNLTSNNNGINGRSGLSVSGSAAPFLVDFDNDGALDLLVGDGSGQITLFANLQLAGENRISFDQGVSLVQVQSGAVPFVVDWNNDGRKDLLVGQADDTLKLFVNIGLEQAPAFAAAVDLQTVNGSLNAGSGLAPAVLDYNGDGNKDLLVGNAAGEVHVFINQGSDADPQLADSVVLLTVAGAVVPMPVDWDADGQQELMLTADGAVTVYHQVNGEYQAGQQFSDRRDDYNGAFPIDLEGSGKHLLVGLVNGELTYLTGNSNELTASFKLALFDKIDQLGGLVAETSPALLEDVSTIAALVELGNFKSARVAVENLAVDLSAGEAQNAAFELAGLL